MVKVLWGLLLIPALFMGCGKSSNSNTNIQEGAASGSIIVHVSDGNPMSQPIYSWEDTTNNNDTTAMKIEVVRTSASSTPVWGVISNPASQNLIQSPWQQGSSTASVTLTATQEVDLQSNIEYQVTITKVDNTFGSRKFTIMP